MLKLLLLIFVLIVSSSVQNSTAAQPVTASADSSSTVNSTETSPDTTKKSGIAGFPYISYTPETKLSVGLAGIYFFRNSDDVNFARPSSISPGIEYTQRKQLTIVTNYDLYFSNGSYRLFGRGSYEKYPFDFYGIGNSTSESLKEQYTPNSFTLNTSFLFNLMRDMVGQGLNVGATYQFRHDKIAKTKANSLLSSGLVRGYNGGVVSGLGLMANWDTRNNVFSASEGGYYEFSMIFFGKLFGSDYFFNRYVFDGRKYFSVTKEHVLAVQTYLSFIAGNPPFYMLSMLGGDLKMRGHILGRFRDNHMMVVQTEYRLPLWWRFGLVGFVGFGDVSHKIRGFRLDSIKHSYGLGLRFFIKPEEKIALRFDYGIADNSSQFYITFLEAF
ncbi:MAG: BamA/TamA family outer membrane protein [Chlorobiales bacterium]|nr:BamA/TamA family outer membrane protein [Chlorobiales bacterium]